MVSETGSCRRAARLVAEVAAGECSCFAAALNAEYEAVRQIGARRDRVGKASSSLPAVGSSGFWVDGWMGGCAKRAPAVVDVVEGKRRGDGAWVKAPSPLGEGESPVLGCDQSNT